MEESARAMRLALEDAGLRAEDVDAVQHHGTSTQVNDALETKAVKLALGAHAGRVRGSSIKSMIGHPQGACGAAAAVAVVCAMKGLDGGEGFVPPTINLTEADPQCDLDYTPGAAGAGGAQRVLVNCLAFGAKHSAIVIEG